MLELLNRAEDLAEEARQEAIRNEPPPGKRIAAFERLLEQTQASH